MKKYLISIMLLAVGLNCLSNNNPNVIVILADDIGMGDISQYRRLHSDKIILETPNIDRLAKDGMMFTDAHSPAALCAPSRYAIMTGSSCYRSEFPWGVWGAYEKSPIKQNQLTLGKLMKGAGYQTAFFGKWHLGGDWKRKDDPHTIYRGSRNPPEVDVDIREQLGGTPKQQGFDYSFAYPAGIQDVPYAVYENSKWYPLGENSEIGYISQENMTKIGVKLDKMEGLGDSNWEPHKMGPLLVSKAVDFINRSAKKKTPFFMYYCSQAVHLPHNPPAELNGHKIKGSTPSPHMDMIKELDVQVEMMIEALKKKGVYKNTLFIFTSDNGGIGFGATKKSGHMSSDIYRGAKNQIHEGGHRVPFIVSWPGNIKPNSVSDEPVLGLDIMATLAAVTGEKIADDQAMDSSNLLPILLNKKKSKGHLYLMIQGGTKKAVAITENEWKLIIQIDKKDKTDKIRKPVALFNLEKNPTEEESGNLIDSPEHKTMVERLFKKYNETRDRGIRTGER